MSAFLKDRNHTVDAIFRCITPSIVDAWLVNAPQQPDDACTIMVLFPPAVFSPQWSDGPILERAVRELSIVETAEIVARLTDELPEPGIHVTCAPWNVVRQRAGVFSGHEESS